MKSKFLFSYLICMFVGLWNNYSQKFSVWRFPAPLVNQPISIENTPEIRVPAHLLGLLLFPALSLTLSPLGYLKTKHTSQKKSSFQWPVSSNFGTLQKCGIPTAAKEQQQQNCKGHWKGKYRCFYVTESACAARVSVEQADLTPLA